MGNWFTATSELLVRVGGAGGVWGARLRRRDAAGGRLYNWGLRRWGGGVPGNVFTYAWRRRGDVDGVCASGG